MSREIKFRAWRKNEKKMFDVSLLRYFQTLERVGLFYNDFEYNGFTQVDLKLVELMQFTGLKDRNGKEIYEGDILKYGDEEDGIILQMIWNNFGDEGYDILRQKKDNVFHDIRINRFDEESEVIGNIHENPELLENKKAVKK